MQTIIESLGYPTETRKGMYKFLFSRSAFLNGSITPLLITKDCESETSLLGSTFLLDLLRCSSTISWIKGFIFPNNERDQKEAADLLRATRYNSRTLRRLELFTWSDHIESFILEHTQCLERFAIYSLDDQLPLYEKIFKHLAPTLTKLQLHNLEQDEFTNDDFLHIRHMNHLQYLELGAVSGFTGENAEEVFLNLSKSLTILKIHDCPSVINVSSIGSLTLLQHLEIDFEAGMETNNNNNNNGGNAPESFSKQISEKWNFPYLQACCLRFSLTHSWSNRPALGKALEFLLTCNHLEKLTLARCIFSGKKAGDGFYNALTTTPIKNAPFLSTLLHLELDSCQLTDFSLLNGIANLKNLKRISFSEVQFRPSQSETEDESETATIPQKVVPWSCAESLKEFCYYGSEALDTLEFLLPCKKLESLIFEDCGFNSDDAMIDQLMSVVEQNSKTLANFIWRDVTACIGFTSLDRVVDAIFATTREDRAFPQLAQLSLRCDMRSSTLKEIARLAPCVKDVKVLRILDKSEAETKMRLEECLSGFENLHLVQIDGLEKVSDAMKAKHPNLNFIRSS